MGSKHSCQTVSTKRSANAFALGRQQRALQGQRGWLETMILAGGAAQVSDSGFLTPQARGINTFVQLQPFEDCTAPYSLRKPSMARE